MKRESLCSPEYQKGTDSERKLIEWANLQDSYLMSIEEISEHFKLEIATTLAEMYGDPILNKQIKQNSNYSRTGKIEQMINEILYLSGARQIRTLTEGDMFGE